MIYSIKRGDITEFFEGTPEEISSIINMLYPAEESVGIDIAEIRNRLNEGLEKAMAEIAPVEGYIKMEYVGK